MSLLTVQELLEDQGKTLELEILAGAKGLQNPIGHQRIQKYSLAFAGYFRFFHPDRVQIMGETEVSYLQTLPPPRQTEVIDALFAHPICCVVVTKSLEVPPSLLAAADRSQAPVLRSARKSSVVMTQLSAYVEDRLAPKTTVHGVLMDVYGVGVLILGKSGIGKSESALHLIQRGHRLIADDVVEVRQKENILVGSGLELLRHHIEIRGMGIVSIRDLFGVAAIRDHKKIELVVHLQEWDPRQDYDRLGLDEETHTLLGLDIPLVRAPVRPGRNISTIIEVSARNQLLRVMGYHSAEVLDRELLQQLIEVPTASKSFERNEE